MKKVSIFCHSFQKVKTIYYIDSLHIEWNISSLYFLTFWWLWLTENENPKFSVSEKLEYYIRSIKRDILYRNVRLLKSMLIYMHSIFGWAFFCMNYCINAAWHEDNQPVALLRCNGSPGCFDSGLQVICIFGSGVSHRFSLGFRSGEFAGQSSTVTLWSLNHLLVPLAVWGRCQVLLENEIRISIKLLSRRKNDFHKISW